MRELARIVMQRDQLQRVTVAVGNRKPVSSAMMVC